MVRRVACEVRRDVCEVHRVVSVWSAALSVRFAVLSPILFLVYIYDLEEGVTGNIIY